MVAACVATTFALALEVPPVTNVPVKEATLILTPACWVSSFRDLKRNELKLAESLKIKIYKVKKGDTYSSLSDKSPISYDPESKLRLLNGDYPDGKLLPGRLIKIVD